MVAAKPATQRGEGRDHPRAGALADGRAAQRRRDEVLQEGEAEPGEHRGERHAMGAGREPDRHRVCHLAGQRLAQPIEFRQPPGGAGGVNEAAALLGRLEVEFARGRQGDGEVVDLHQRRDVPRLGGGMGMGQKNQVGAHSAPFEHVAEPCQQRGLAADIAAFHGPFEPMRIRIGPDWIARREPGHEPNGVDHRGFAPHRTGRPSLEARTASGPWGRGWGQRTRLNRTPCRGCADEGGREHDRVRGHGHARGGARQPRRA